MATAPAPAPHQILEAIVTRVDGKGFTVYGREGWLNIGRHAPAEDVPMPEPGDRVELALDGQSFVRKVVVLDGRHAPSGEPEHLLDEPHERPTRDAIVTRLAVLNAATAILSSGGCVADTDDVVSLAARLEYWATRG